MTDQEMRARRFSETDIAYVKKLSADRFRQQRPVATKGPAQAAPEQKPPPAHPLEFLMNLLRGK